MIFTTVPALRSTKAERALPSGYALFRSNRLPRYLQHSHPPKTFQDIPSPPPSPLSPRIMTTYIPSNAGFCGLRCLICRGIGVDVDQGLTAWHDGGIY